MPKQHNSASSLVGSSSCGIRVHHSTCNVRSRLQWGVLVVAWKIVRGIWPGLQIFSCATPDIRWVHTHVQRWWMQVLPLMLYAQVSWAPTGYPQYRIRSCILCSGTTRVWKPRNKWRFNFFFFWSRRCDYPWCSFGWLEGLPIGAWMAMDTTMWW